MFRALRVLSDFLAYGGLGGESSDCKKNEGFEGEAFCMKITNTRIIKLSAIKFLEI